MGSFDIFCAICGATVRWFDQDMLSNNETEEEQKSFKLLEHEETAWINEFRCISENPNSQSADDKVYVSGPASYSDYGICDVEEDENLGQFAGYGHRYDIHVYGGTGDEDDPLAFPCHNACNKILRKVIRSISFDNEKIDKEVLFLALKSFVEGEPPYDRCLGLVDYGECMDELQQQYWYILPGVEYYMVNPVNIPALERYYSNIPTLLSSEHTPPSADTVETRLLPGVVHDYFAEVPVKILLHILQYLPIDSVNALRTVSSYVTSATSSSSFWEKRLRQDMPWLYDIPEENNSNGQGVDWAQVCQDLHEKSHNNCESRILGLVNRKRIWKICDLFAASYFNIKKAKDYENSTAVLKNAFSGPMVPLGDLGKVKTETSKLALISDVNDVGVKNPVLSIYWSREGFLLGFGVTLDTATTGQKASGDSDYVGAKGKAARTDEVKIPQGDWLTGFMFMTRIGLEDTHEEKKNPGRFVIGIELLFNTTESMHFGASNGNKRLVLTEPGEVIVGLLVEWTATSGILNLALLKHEKRVSFQEIYPYADSSLNQVLWKDDIPPPILQMSRLMNEGGSWVPDGEFCPHEAVIFGRDDEELSTITGISVDVQFGVLEIHYSHDRPSKSVGPKPWATKTFAIDGPGGERIIAAFVGNNIQLGFRLVTNRNRQLTYGLNLYPTRQDSLNARETGIFCGLSCSWSMNDSDQPRLDAVATLSLPKPSHREYHDGLDIFGLQDQNKLWWEPDAPPPTWKESGSIYGSQLRKLSDGYQYHIASTEPVTTDGNVVSWFDLRRPVDEIKVTFTHGHSWIRKRVSLISIILQYTDGSQASSGPTQFFIDSEDADEENEIPWIWYHQGFKGTDEEDRVESPFYRHDSFTAGGDFIACVRIWAKQFLRGFQFLTCSGLEGPKWGICEGDAATTIRFTRGGNGASEQDDGEQRAVGLKVFTGVDRQQFSYRRSHSSRIITGFQALVVE
ncbi:hypothetical protein BGW36DRAFT_435497 [Talaromyces proteolyticus]|uniref:F-box domain-containing protein n=1 Tax=Talaromyces proteolyticus TaxID=1131652 RepID=A0AAD4Q6G2_9EURO|nr:uncharacterized protein BGW36DRAFT_435497 [Talaromyces proteolyticus]KAH8705613.1 hypothetical protein BGW36DRAFT_435497 [Talaromyces proteolyticus]